MPLTAGEDRLVSWQTLSYSRLSVLRPPTRKGVGGGKLFGISEQFGPRPAEMAMGRKPTSLHAAEILSQM